jgi:hypothetical protein
MAVSESRDREAAQAHLDSLDDPRWLAQLPGPSAENIDRV